MVMDRPVLLQKIWEEVVELGKTNQSKNQPPVGLWVRNIRSSKGREIRERTDCSIP